MDYKKPGQSNWQSQRVLMEELNFVQSDFQSNGLLSEQGILKAEQLLEPGNHFYPPLSELFHIYSESLKNHRLR